jgi:hypothetical protein
MLWPNNFGSTRFAATNSRTTSNPTTKHGCTLAGELPTYTDNIKEKIKSLRQLGHGTDRLEKMTRGATASLSASCSGSPEPEEHRKGRAKGGRP